MATTAIGTRADELAATRFCVDIEGLLVATFRECSGLSAEVEIQTYQEGGLNDYEHKLPGRSKWGNLTLRSGVASSDELWKWFYRVATGDIERREVSIVMYHQSQEEARRWNLAKAYPVRWQGPDLTAGDTNVAVHTLELAHNGIWLSSR